MAAGRIVLSAYMPALDLNGDPVAGAKLYVYENQTTDLASIYSNSGLSVALANPVVADAAGQFPDVWASDAVTYTLSVTGASGESIGAPSAFDNYAPSAELTAYEASTAAQTAADIALQAQGAAEAAQEGAEAAQDGAAASASAAAAQLALVTAAGAAAVADIDDASAANFYDDAAAGIAGTVDGEWFKTVEDGRIVTYKNVSEVAVEKAVSYSQADVDQIGVDLEATLDARIEQEAGEASLHVFLDSNERVTAYQKDDLNWMLPDPDTGTFASVQDTMRAATSDDGENAIAVWADSEDRVGAYIGADWGLHLTGLDGSVQDEIGSLQTSVDASVAAEAARVNKGLTRAMFEGEVNRAASVTEIYHHITAKAQGADSTETQRIPGLVKLTDTTAVVFWQQRLAGYGYVGDAQYQRLVCASITITPGVGDGITVGSTVVVDAPADVTKNSNHPHAFVNGDGVLICVFNSTDNVDGTYKVYSRASSDGGATWGSRVELISTVSGSSYVALGSNGSVVQIPAGYDDAGSWMIPIYAVGDAGNFSGVLIVNDDGQTAAAGPLLTNGLGINECSIAPTHEDSVLMSMRRSDNPGFSHFAVLPFGSDDWEDLGLNENVVNAECNTSMVQTSPEIGGGMPFVVHIGPASAARRTLRLRLTADAGRTFIWEWARPDVLDTAFVGYSAVVMMTRGLILFATETAGSATTDSDIDLHLVNIEKVLNDGSAL